MLLAGGVRFSGSCRTYCSLKLIGRPPGVARLKIIPRPPSFWPVSAAQASLPRATSPRELEGSSLQQFGANRGQVGQISIVRCRCRPSVVSRSAVFVLSPPGRVRPSLQAISVLLLREPALKHGTAAMCLAVASLWSTRRR